MILKDARQITGEFAMAMGHYLEKRNMNLTRLSERTGISVAYLCRIKNGERKAPSVPVAVGIIKALGMPSSSLLRILDLEDENDEENALDLYELIFFNDFTIEGEPVGTEEKEIITDILQSIITCEWSKKTIAHDVTVLAGKIEKFKKQNSL